MSALPKDALRRGWCPSTLRPMETGDGWLVRLHPPGARLTPVQLRRIATLAAEHGNGLIEISARANLQIRGVRAESHPLLVERLLAENLVDEHAGDGPQRVTLVSPLAGWSPTARIDAAALAAQIEPRACAVSGLPAKLSVVLDDGGAQALDEFPCDIRLVGVAAGRAALCLGDRLWRGPIAEAEAAPAVETALRHFAALRRAAPDCPRRLRDLAPEALASLSSLPEAAAPAPRMPPRRAGLFAAEGDRFAAVIGLPFGRCDAATLDRLGAAEDIAEIRLSPWRGLAFRDLDRAEAGAVALQMRSLPRKVMPIPGSDAPAGGADENAVPCHPIDVAAKAAGSSPGMPNSALASVRPLIRSLLCVNPDAAKLPQPNRRAKPWKSSPSSPASPRPCRSSMSTPT